MVILAPFEAFKIGLVSPKTLFGQGSLGILRWSTIGTIGHVGCDIHYSHDGHYGFVSHIYIYILHSKYSFVLHYSLLIFDNNFFA